MVLVNQRRKSQLHHHVAPASSQPTLPAKRARREPPKIYDVDAGQAKAARKRDSEEEQPDDEWLPPPPTSSEKRRPSSRTPGHSAKRDTRPLAASDKTARSDEAPGKARGNCNAKSRGSSSSSSVKLTSRDAAMTSQRRLRRALVEPSYDMELVAEASPDLEHSVLCHHAGNEAWESLLAEMVLLCSEAAWRRSQMEVGGGRADPKPLMLEYVSDRVDTDEPLWGYACRSRREFWLQGFVCLTVFTTWTPYFRFTTDALAAAITASDVANRIVDESLTRELEAQRRSGDPEGEGVVWPRVAEISLLGGLGCGRKLVALALDDLRENGFDYVVLQATDQAISFYERLGFARVGAVASFESNPSAQAFFHDHRPCPTNTGAKLYWARRLARFVLRELRLADKHGVFLQPVDENVAPGYSAVVTNPVDISTMRRRLVEGADLVRQAACYLLEDLERDFETMIANCLAYNDANSKLAKYACEMRAIGRALFSRAQTTYPDLVALSPDDLAALNSDDLSSLTADFEATANDDTQVVMGYVHWTFPDQPVEDQYPSYLMAMRLRQHPAAHALEQSADAALEAAEHALHAATHAALAAQHKRAPPASSAPPPPPERNSSVAPTLEVALGRALNAKNAVPAAVRFPAKRRVVPRSDVTPRGRGFMAKLQRGAAVEYLGIFETAAAAQQAYDAAKADVDKPRLKVRPRPDPPGATAKRRDQVWLARQAERTSPLPLRAVSLTSQYSTAEILRQLAASTPIPQPQDVPVDGSPTVISKRRCALYNNVVTVDHLPPCYPHRYWFVYQYVPDMEWCHVCPMEQHGVFAPNSKRAGRPRWRLVPEGEAREIDVSAKRCTPVKHETVVKTPSADKEIFDILGS